MGPDDAPRPKPAVAARRRSRGTHPFAEAKPDTRLIELLLGARSFNATLAPQRRRSLSVNRCWGLHRRIDRDDALPSNTI